MAQALELDLRVLDVQGAGEPAPRCQGGDAAADGGDCAESDLADLAETGNGTFGHAGEHVRQLGAAGSRSDDQAVAELGSESGSGTGGVDSLELPVEGGAEVFEAGNDVNPCCGERCHRCLSSVMWSPLFAAGSGSCAGNACPCRAVRSCAPRHAGSYRGRMFRAVASAWVSCGLSDRP